MQRAPSLLDQQGGEKSRLKKKVKPRASVVRDHNTIKTTLQNAELWKNATERRVVEASRVQAAVTPPPWALAYVFSNSELERIFF